MERHEEVGRILSKVLIRGLGSKACCEGPERRFAGTALSERSSIKSLTIKSLFEKFSSVKLGPLGNNVLALPPPLFKEDIDNSRDLARPPCYIETCDDPQ